MLAVYADSLGASATMVGVLVAGFSTARLVINVPAGYMAARLGHRSVMTVGLLILASSSLAPYFVPDLNVLWASIVVQGVGSSMFSTSVLVAIAALSTADTRVRDMASYQAAQVVGTGVGPALGGTVVALWGHSAPFLWQMIMALIAMLSIQTIRPTAAPAPPPAPAVRGAIAAPARLAIAGVALMTFAALSIRVAGAWFVLPLIAQSRVGASTSQIGLMLTAGAVATGLMLPIVPRIVRRVGRGPVVAGATVISLGGLWFLATGTTLFEIALSSALFGFATGFAMPTLSAYAVDLSPAGKLGAAMGLLRTVTDAAFVVGPVAIGLLVDRMGIGYSGALMWAGVMLVACNGFFALTIRRKLPS
jgi:MFS family permease